MKFNERIERVQLNRYKEVPIEKDSSLWLFWIYTDGTWDSDTINNWKEYIDLLKENIVVNIFCVWHGKRRTNLFLMDRDNLIKRLNKFKK